ncbi:hypothetical protein NEOKW01_1310 [Nematocida sp. AWRm80]|nr:hypothetical protein NEOKW01_1310 [Nematocida sp. AWRm80]
MIHILIGTDDAYTLNKSIKNESLGKRINYITSIVVTWALFGVSLIYLGGLVAAFAQTSPAIAIGILASYISGATMLFWLKKNCSENSTSKNNELFLLSFFIAALFFAIPGVLSGNPWMLFFPTSILLSGSTYVWLLLPSLFLMGICFIYPGSVLASILGGFPAILIMIVLIEYLFSHMSTKKSFSETYNNSIAIVASIGFSLFAAGVLILSFFHIDVLPVSSIVN